MYSTLLNDTVYCKKICENPRDYYHISLTYSHFLYQYFAPKKIFRIHLFSLKKTKKTWWYCLVIQSWIKYLPNVHFNVKAFLKVEASNCQISIYESGLFKLRVPIIFSTFVWLLLKLFNHKIQIFPPILKPYSVTFYVS